MALCRLSVGLLRRREKRRGMFPLPRRFASPRYLPLQNRFRLSSRPRNSVSTQHFRSPQRANVLFCTSSRKSFASRHRPMACVIRHEEYIESAT